MSAWSQYLYDHVADVVSSLRGVLDHDWIQQHKLSLSLTAGSAILAVGWIIMKQKENANLPPGPWGFPFLGAMHVLGSEMHKDIRKLQRKYGNVHSLRIGSDLYVMVCGYEALKEAFVKAGDDFTGRPVEVFNRLDLEGFKDELVMVDYGDEFKSNRRFALSALKKFGFGLPSMEGKIQEETENLIKQINENEENQLNPANLIRHTLAKLITSITIAGGETGEDIDYDKYIKLMGRVVHEEESEYETLLFFLPVWLSTIFLKKEVKKYREEWKSVMDFMRERLRVHKNSLNPENPRDVTDMYLLDTNERSDDSICSNLIMLQADGVITLGHALLSCLGYVAQNPLVMKKIHEELDRIVGPKGPVTLKHKQDLPYLQATILEGFRCSDIFPVSFTRKAMKDSTLAGYRIPRNTYMMPILCTLHYDEQLFPNPEKFDPEHFLDASGALTKTEYCMPFALGKRSCLGEPLARMEHYLILANLFHQFIITFPEQDCPQDFHKFINSFMKICLPFELQFNKRL